MSMKYIRDHYGVPAQRGARVRFQPYQFGNKAWNGTITSAAGQYLRIRRDGDKRTYPARFHPTFGLTYLEAGNEV